MSGGDLGKGFDLDAGDGAGERRQQLASVEVVICQFELAARLVVLSPGAEQSGPRLVEDGLCRHAPLQKLFLALEIAFCVVQLRLGLLHAGAGLVDLALQRARIDFRQHVTQLHLLADGEGDRLQLAADLEREAADIGRLQDAGKTANAAFGLCGDLVGPQTAHRLFARFLLFIAAALQADQKHRRDRKSRESSDHAGFPLTRPKG